MELTGQLDLLADTDLAVPEPPSREATRAEELRRRLWAVLELHIASDDNGLCYGCDHPSYPCPTVRAARGVS